MDGEYIAWQGPDFRSEIGPTIEREVPTHNPA